MQQSVQTSAGGPPSIVGRMWRRLTLLVLVASLPFLLWSVLPVGSSAQDPGKIQKKIDRNNSLIGGHKAKERVLTTDISRQSSKINTLQTDITRLSTRQQKLQSDLDAKRAELAVVQRKLRRLVELYKADAPDAITVVLESEGFADLLTRADFMERVSRQDSKIMGIVADAKAEATTTAKKLDSLEKQQAKVAAQIETQRDAVSNVRVGLVDRRDRIQSARADKSRLLASSRDRRHELEDDVASLQKQQVKITAKLAGFSGPVAAGPVKQGSGGLIWPVNGPITSPFCESRSWESCHPGIDIGVPAGTPIRAAAAGKVVLMQGTGVSGGYGNFTCIQHTSSLSTCYAHQSRFATSMGAQVSQGQVIGYVGCTGRCFGDHLHFETRINGSVVSPLNYL
jgi:murein DD-endopeptidase MepM/ murein hydrolase activator NlpD